MNDVIYLEFNNWFGGRDYPEIPNIEDWVGRFDVPGYKSPLVDDEWCKEQKICVLVGSIDMSANFCITASREWVEKNCPECLTDEDYDITMLVCNEKKIYHYNYGQFRCEPEEDGKVYGKFGWEFLEYNEENFGRHWYEEHYEDE